MRWHLCCRVVDNLGDVGVAWRLAADLAARGEAVRLAIDDRSALAWMAPAGAPGVDVCDWSDPVPTAPDVVVELFGGGVPGAVAATAEVAFGAPVFVNVEHLSAEGYVERSHGLASPRRTASGSMLTTWFFYPGFSGRTGGLLREPGLLARRAAFDADAWLRAFAVEPRPGERRVALFCYDDSAVASLLAALAGPPTLLLLAHGAATALARTELGPTLRRGALRAFALPRLAQTDFDHLLWSCDLNVVRGEDSPVRAIWAGAPFVWQLYVQDDGAHHAKLAAFVDRFLAGAPGPLAAPVRRLFAAWNAGANGSIDGEALAPAALAAWAAHAHRRRDELAARDDLATELIRFARSKR